MPVETPDGYKLERKWSLTHFLIGVFGAAAILGVMAKIFSFEFEVFGYLVTWKPVVFVGFMGEALVFILMGTIREMQYVPVDEEDDQLSGETGGGSPEQTPIPELEIAEEKLTQEAEHLAQKIRAIRENLAEELDVLEQFNTLRDNLERASDNLSDHSEALGANMEGLQDLHEAQFSIAQSIESVQRELSEESEGLSREIAETRKVMRTFREQFAQATRRFEQFNHPPSAGGSSGDGHDDDTVAHSIESNSSSSPP